MKSIVKLNVNGRPYEVAVQHNHSLLEVLRYDLGLTGSKQGCDKGDCGACTVLVDGAPILACCTLAATVDPNADITTIEGLSNGQTLNSVQEAFDRCGALQCGFCQSGMMLSARALLNETLTPTSDEVREALSGNLCRCTGYTQIFEAVELAASIERGEAEPYEPASAEGYTVLGGRHRKSDGHLKATGKAIYTDDITPPQCLHGKILRSPHAHAEIVSIDTSRAEALPGVVAVLTGEELPNVYGVIPWTQDEQALCTDRVRFVGDEVAAVAAIDEETAQAALELIEVEYQVLPAVMDPFHACDEDMPLLFPGRRKGNLTKRVQLSFGEVDKALADADVLVEGDYLFEGTAHAPIEPHCVVAECDSRGLLTLTSSTQIPHYVHRTLAKVLELPADRIRVIQPALGGAFGGKSDPFGHEIVAAKLAMNTGQPVKILLNREETFFTHRGRHPMHMKMALAATRDGRLTALDSNILIDGGAYTSFGLVTTYYSGQLLTATTRFDTYRFDSSRVFTNKPPCGPKRGHGSVQPRFAYEIQLDKMAEKLGLDPIELRRINDLGPHSETVNGQRVTSNGFLQCLDVVEAASEWKTRRGKLPYGRGLGVAGSTYISGTAYPVYPNEMPQSGVQLRIDRSGRAHVMCGASDIGQGSDTMLALIVAEELGLDPSKVVVTSSDTDLSPVDLGAYSSRVTFMAGLACQEAARNLAARIRDAVGHALEVPSVDIACGDGHWFSMTDPGKRLSCAEAFVAAETEFGTLGTTGGYRTDKTLGGKYRGGTIGASPAYSFTAHIAEVDVDVETGWIDVKKIWAAHDCGFALNPTLVEGQIAGSVYMGWAEAVMEEQAFAYGGLNPGLLRGPSLLDYRIPTSVETPEIECFIVQSVDPNGPYGAKEAGEGPLHPILPAIANAVYDAVGIRLDRLPFHPSVVRAALRAKEEGVC
ncbi:MAG: molybdopterin cofactor-binding domain-containing protein [Myxococcota bacterium]|nr:molybdopterin cofactor-binding domain-containing protein [Myxococcota bacterium]